MSDNGKDQPQPVPGDQQQVPVLAQIVHNPETNEMGIVIAPAVTDHVLFGLGVQDLIAQVIRNAHMENMKKSPIVRPNPPGILRP